MCSWETELVPELWRCARCDGPLGVPLLPIGAPSLLAVGSGIPRYQAWLPVPSVSFDEPTTPLVRASWGELDLYFKVEGCLPTGSFKDRGSATLVGWLRDSGVERVVADSSGNAGASIAAYCARARIACDVYVSSTASPVKLAQIAAYGASVIPISGPRQAAAEAALDAAMQGAIYASHLWNPLFLAGTRTFAFEVWEQLGSAPDAVVMPVGGGTLLLGVAQGFLALKQAGLIEREPRLYGVQSSACAPLAQAAASGATAIPAIAPAASAADGILIAVPPRGAEIMASVRSTEGTVIAIDEDALWSAFGRLGRLGLYVEPTSAVAAAALALLEERGEIVRGQTTVVALTGTGLKAGTRAPTP